MYMVSTIQHIEINNINWYKGNDVAQLLGYSCHCKAVISHVVIGDGKPLKYLRPEFQHDYSESITIYINEHGMRRLITICQLQNSTKIADHCGIKEETNNMRK